MPPRQMYVTTPSAVAGNWTIWSCRPLRGNSEVVRWVPGLIGTTGNCVPPPGAVLPPCGGPVRGSEGTEIDPSASGRASMLGGKSSGLGERLGTWTPGVPSIGGRSISGRRHTPLDLGRTALGLLKLWVRRCDRRCGWSGSGDICVFDALPSSRVWARQPVVIPKCWRSRLRHRTPEVDWGEPPGSPPSDPYLKRWPMTAPLLARVSRHELRGARAPRVPPFGADDRFWSHESRTADDRQAPRWIFLGFGAGAIITLKPDLACL